jgi:3-oxoacyl-[acyl-carrier-protein] synthase III
MGVLIAGLGYYLPENRVTNDELLEMVKTKSGQAVDLEKLRERLLLNKAFTRYFKNSSATGVDMAAQAAQKCLTKIGFDPLELDCILYVGMLRDYVEPAMAVILQARLEAKNAHAFDLANACNSFLNGMEIAEMFIRTGKYHNILIVGAEDGSERIPWHLFNDNPTSAGFSALTLADGAAAMLLQHNAEQSWFTEFVFRTYGQYHDLCRIKIGKAKDDLKVIVKSRKLAMTAMGILPQFVTDFMKTAQTKLGRIDIWFFHQVTGAPNKFWGDLADELVDKAYNTFSDVGNTGSISIPLGMALAEERGKLKRGDCVVAIVGASGFSCGATAFVY